MPTGMPVLMDTELTDLVGKFANGDQRAFAELVGRFKKKIYQVAYRMLGNHLDADEVTQETFVRLYEKRAELDTVKYFPGFILRIAINYSIDLLRRQRRKFISVDELVFLPEVQARLADRIAGPDESLENAEILTAVKEAIEKLPPRQKIAIILHDLEGFSKLEIAHALGCPQATVRSNLHIARTKMRKWLRKRLELRGIR